MFTSRKYCASLVTLSLICNCGQTFALQLLQPVPSKSAVATATPAASPADSINDTEQNRQNLPNSELPILHNRASVGKPTSAAPSFEPPVVISWGQLPDVNDRRGDRKSVVAASPPAAAPPATATRAERSYHGAGKPNTVAASAAPDANVDVVNVGWSASRRSFADGKAMQTSVAFQSKECPRLQFATSRLVPVPRTDSDVVKAKPTAEIQLVDAGQPQLTSLAHSNPVAIHSANMQALQQLTRDALKTPPTLSETYLNELQSLVQGPSAWLFTNGALLDLAPHAGDVDSIGPSYLEELESLVPDTSKTAQGKPSERKSPQQGASQKRFIQVARQNMLDEQAYVPPSARGYYELGPEKTCEGSGGEALTDKFSPLSSIRLSGGSTAPPQTSGGTENEMLNRPDNAACAYLDSSFPAFYQPPTQFGVRRPHRYPQKFCHNPLYFEDANLERCGQSNGCLTTVGSAIQFGTQIALLPYLTTATHPDDCVEALPDCPTCAEFGPEAYFPRWSWKAAAVQAGAITGVIYLFP